MERDALAASRLKLTEGVLRGGVEALASLSTMVLKWFSQIRCNLTSWANGLRIGSKVKVRAKRDGGSYRETVSTQVVFILCRRFDVLVASDLGCRHSSSRERLHLRLFRRPELKRTAREFH